MDDETLAELREEMEEEMNESAVVSESIDLDGPGGESVEDDYGGLLRSKDGSPGTKESNRTYKCRVTMPTSHNVKQENISDNESDTITKALIVFPWNAVVYHTSKITVTFRDARVIEFQATQVEPHSDPISTHVYATRLGV